MCKDESTTRREGFLTWPLSFIGLIITGMGLHTDWDAVRKTGLWAGGDVV